MQHIFHIYIDLFGKKSGYNVFKYSFILFPFITLSITWKFLTPLRIDQIKAKG